jgi:hypothetical protein
MDSANYDTFRSFDEDNMDEMKRITHILEQAKNMCEGGIVDFKGISKFTKDSHMGTIPITEQGLDKSTLMSPDTDQNEYLKGNLYTDEKENWAQATIDSLLDQQNATGYNEIQNFMRSYKKPSLTLVNNKVQIPIKNRVKAQ